VGSKPQHNPFDAVNIPLVLTAASISGAANGSFTMMSMGLAGADLGLGEGNASVGDNLKDVLRQFDLLLPKVITMQGSIFVKM
jgi:hypothetical protein